MSGRNVGEREIGKSTVWWGGFTPRETEEVRINKKPVGSKTALGEGVRGWKRPGRAPELEGRERKRKGLRCACLQQTGVGGPRRKNFKKEVGKEEV